MIRPWIAILLIPLSFFSLSSERPFSQADSDWTYKHFYPVLDELMPLQGTAGAYVVYRAHSESDIPEYWFVIGYDPNQDGHELQKYLSVHVRVADTHSVFGQIMRAHRSEPREDIASIEKRIELRTFELNEMTCPAIKDQVEILEKLQVNVPKFHDPGVFILGHPEKSEFHIKWGLQQMRVVLVDDGKLPHENALLNWAYWTRRAINDCAQAITD